MELATLPCTPDFNNLLTYKIAHGNVMNLNMLPWSLMPLLMIACRICCSNNEVILQSQPFCGGQVIFCFLQKLLYLEALSACHHYALSTSQMSSPIYFS
jgi:hypothetical protein